MEATDITIRDARSVADMATLRELFTEYQRWLGVDLCFQGFEAELAGLPGRYAPPGGCLLLAEEAGAAAGCVGVWALEAGICEMKRLWVRPRWRGRGLGRRLAEDSLAASRAAGYRRMRLDSLAHLTEALALYRSMGFTVTAPYYDNPLPGVVYLELDLGAATKKPTAQRSGS